MKSNMTFHAKVERGNRFDYILNTVGFGEQVISCDDKTRNATKCLTNTGVMVIKAKDNNKIITSYIATLHEAKTVYETVTGNAMLPRSIYLTVQKNVPLLADQPNN